MMRPHCDIELHQSLHQVLRRTLNIAVSMCLGAPPNEEVHTHREIEHTTA